MDELAAQSLPCPLWNPFEIASQTCDIHEAPTIDEFEENLKFVVLLLYLYSMIVVPNHPFFLAKWRKNIERPEEDRKRINNAIEERVHECPICLSPQAEFPVVTNCGHVFCCECIIRWWLSNNGPFDVGTCALCRRMFTELLRIEWDNFNEDPELKRNLNVYNKRFDPNRRFIDSLRDFPDFFYDYVRDPIETIMNALEELPDWVPRPTTVLFCALVTIFVDWVYKMYQQDVGNNY